MVCLTAALLYCPAGSRKLFVESSVLNSQDMTKMVFIPYVWAKYLLTIKVTNEDAVCRKHCY